MFQGKKEHALFVEMFQGKKEIDCKNVLGWKRTDCLQKCFQVKKNMDYFVEAPQGIKHGPFLEMSEGIKQPLEMSEGI